MAQNDERLARLGAGDAVACPPSQLLDPEVPHAETLVLRPDQVNMICVQDSSRFALLASAVEALKLAGLVIARTSKNVGSNVVN